MQSPRSLVIPFGVPDEGRGLGLGIAALVHTFVQLDGEAVAIAQLHARRRESSPPGGAAPPVEVFVPPAAWRDIAGRGDGPSAVGTVVTGSFEPPADGSGTIRLLAFDPVDGRTRASVDATVDGERAGASLVAAIEDFGGRLGGQIGALRSLRDLDWEPLESVLLAERCALHDPARGGPHDPLAAMLHLGRAIGDAPGARYPAERLAAMGLDAAGAVALDAKLGAAALRALDRASHDASASPELVEAHGALLLRLGDPRGAEHRLNAAIALAPTRPRLYAFLVQALRAQGRLDAARAVLDDAARRIGDDAMLMVEHGALRAAEGDLEGASAAWRAVLARDPVHPGAFGRAATQALRTRDVGAAQALVDCALAASHAPIEVLQAAVNLAFASEAEGIARASRLRRLAERWLERMPGDAGALLVLARALLALGEASLARGRLDAVERSAPGSPAAAEALALRLGIEAPGAEAEVQSVLRAASVATGEHLGDVAARARRLAAAHGSWLSWLAAATAERRLGHRAAARRALEAALEIAPGAPRVHVELAAVLLDLDDAAGAAERARTALRLEGPSPVGLRLLARALAAEDRLDDAVEAARRAVALQPEDHESRALVRALRERAGQEEQKDWFATVQRRLKRFLAR
jgi:tetratricopeptide (TPR) repeat protein